MQKMSLPLNNKNLDFDLFDGDLYYDLAQSYEFRKHGYKVVVPNQLDLGAYTTSLKTMYGHLILIERYLLKSI